MLFANAGKKIKSVAKFLFWFNCIAGSVLALTTVILVTAEKTYTAAEGVGIIFLFVFAVILIWICAWFASLLLYGFGELIDKTCNIEEDTSAVARSFYNIKD